MTSSKPAPPPGPPPTKLEAKGKGNVNGMGLDLDDDYDFDDEHDPYNRGGVPAGHDIGICEHCSNDGPYIYWVQAQLCCIRCKLNTCDTCGQWLGVLKGQPDPGRFERGPWMCWICQGLWAHELIGSFATMALQDQEKGKPKGMGKASGISVSDDGKGCPGISLADAKGKGKDPGERWMTRVNWGPRCEPADADYVRQCRRTGSEPEGRKGTGYDSGKGKGPEDGDRSSNVPPYVESPHSRCGEPREDLEERLRDLSPEDDNNVDFSITYPRYRDPDLDYTNPSWKTS